MSEAMPKTKLTKVRPAPYLDDPPEGLHFEARPDPEWRLRSRGVCRQPKCDAPAVAALNRGWNSYRTVPPTRRDSWWAYCADHLYGRWIEDGQVMGWVLREDTQSDRSNDGDL